MADARFLPIADIGRSDLPVSATKTLPMLDFACLVARHLQSLAFARYWQNGLFQAVDPFTRAHFRRAANLRPVPSKFPKLILKLITPQFKEGERVAGAATRA